MQQQQQQQQGPRNTNINMNMDNSRNSNNLSSYSNSNSHFNSNVGNSDSFNNSNFPTTASSRIMKGHLQDPARSNPHCMENSIGSNNNNDDYYKNQYSFNNSHYNHCSPGFVPRQSNASTFGSSMSANNSSSILPVQDSSNANTTTGHGMSPPVRAHHPERNTTTNPHPMLTHAPGHALDPNLAGNASRSNSRSTYNGANPTSTNMSDFTNNGMARPGFGPRSPPPPPPLTVPHGFDARRGLDTAQRPETAMANNTWNARRAPSPPAARATPDPRAAAPDISQRAQQQPPRNPDATTPLPITPEAANPLITLHMPRLEDINSQVDDDNDDNSDGGALPREEDPEGLSVSSDSVPPLLPGDGEEPESREEDGSDTLGRKIYPSDFCKTPPAAASALQPRRWHLGSDDPEGTPNSAMGDPLTDIDRLVLDRLILPREQRLGLLGYSSPHQRSDQAEPSKAPHFPFFDWLGCGPTRCCGNEQYPHCCPPFPNDDGIFAPSLEDCCNCEFGVYPPASVVPMPVKATDPPRKFIHHE
mmetsp:Transcript_67377/g.146660  ORF Transcript_67377/g.146660 Transcript_67377/m.146660 type:complete len:532 (+) Transcript_67377:387-1982(+)